MSADNCAVSLVMGICLHRTNRVIRNDYSIWALLSTCALYGRKGELPRLSVAPTYLLRPRAEVNLLKKDRSTLIYCCLCSMRKLVNRSWLAVWTRDLLRITVAMIVGSTPIDIHNEPEVSQWCILSWADVWVLHVTRMFPLTQLSL